MICYRKVSSLKQDLFLKIENSGADHPHHLKEMVCLIFIHQTLIRDLSIQCSSSVSCMDGGDMLLTVCTKPNTSLTMNYLKTCTINLTLVCHLFPKSGLDLVDLSSSDDKTSIIINLILNKFFFLAQNLYLKSMNNMIKFNKNFFTYILFIIIFNIKIFEILYLKNEEKLNYTL